MADRSTHFNDPLDFHSCHPPRGMDYYDLTCLTDLQQKRLNTHKIEVVRDHQKYLYKNPEIRAILQIIIRKLLLERPTHDIERFVGNFFSTKWEDIVQEVNKYVQELSSKLSPVAIKPSLKEDRHVTVDASRQSGVSINSSEGTVIELNLVHHTVKDVLEKIIDAVLEQCEFYSPIRFASAPLSDAGQDAEEIEFSKFGDEEDELVFDLELECDLDFTTYHEDDDNKDFSHVKDDKQILQSLNKDAKY